MTEVSLKLKIPQGGKGNDNVWDIHGGSQYTNVSGGHDAWPCCMFLWITGCSVYVAAWCRTTDGMGKPIQHHPVKAKRFKSHTYSYWVLHV